MSRTRRLLHGLLFIALLTASFVSVATPPIAAAADHTYWVDTARDDAGGTVEGCTDNLPNKGCTLRQALAFAASDGGTSEIRFRIPANSSDPDYGYSNNVWTIKLESPLPPLAEGDLTIIGASSFFVPHRIVIDGSALSGASAIGLRITSPRNRIQQMAFVNFDSSGTNGIGIQISGAAAQENEIIDSMVSGNTQAGIKIDTGASKNVIKSEGGLSIISGNGTGILLEGANENTIQGNLIGLTLGTNSFVALPNTGDGIWLNSSNNNTIGGEFEERNIISGNTKSGVLLSNGSANNTLFGNLIGTDDLGTTAIPNGQGGVQIINGANNNTITGSTFTQSIISGNTGYGVLISDATTSNNKIFKSLIGVGDDGTTAVPNTQGGILIRNDANQNVIGEANQGNVISGNTGYGVRVGGSSGFTQTNQNKIIGNVIGLSSDGTEKVANTQGGVLIDLGSTNSLIGGSTTAEANLIAHNGGPGVVISGTTTLDTVLSGNVIGLQRDSNSGKLTVAAPNGGGGIVISGARRTTIGGVTAAEGNIIAGNTGNGVRIGGTDTMTVTLRNNLIGATEDNGLVYRGNSANGVLVEGNTKNVLIESNTIVANGANGVLVTDTAQQVKLATTRFSRNANKAFELDPETSGIPGVATNPNHDIDPPFALTLSDSGVLTGKVLTSSDPAACNGCTFQIFTSDPAVVDGQPYIRYDVPVTFNAGEGTFSATLPDVPQQVLVAATDAQGNTSEFAVKERLYRVEIMPTRPQQEAIPGQTVVFTHIVSNTGTIDFNAGILKLEVHSKFNWPYTIQPTTLPALPAGESVPITLTLTLPTGSDPRVYAGLIEETRIRVYSEQIVTATHSLTDTTLVKPQFLLSVDPLSHNVIAKKNQVVQFGHKLTNNGNITTTVELSATTDLEWQTQITQPTGGTYELAPGKSVDLLARVDVPSTVFAPSEAKTVISITSPGQPDRTQDKILTDTITITSTAMASMTPNYDRDAAAGQTLSLQHVVTNLSNGPMTFKLVVISTSRGSTVTFRSNSSNIPLGADNSFTLGTDPSNNRLNFFADITVNPEALPGTTDTILIGLADMDGTIIAEATVEDLIRINQGQELPRMWLPLILAEQAQE
jgi:hypothetical protein